MIKYTRKQINVKVSLHDKEFVTVDDAENALADLFDKSVEAGVDTDKLMGLLNESD